MLLPVLLAAALFIAGAAALSVAFLLKLRFRSELDHRLGLLARAANSEADVSLNEILRRKAALADARIRRIFALGMSRTWGMKTRSPALLLSAAFAAMAAWLIVRFIFGLPLAASLPVCLLAAMLVPHMVLRLEQGAAECRFTDLFPDAVDTVARMLRSGLPATAAMRTVGDDSQPPVSAVFGRIADQMKIGMSLGDALNAASQQIPLPDFRFFAVAVNLQYATGGNLVQTLDTLSQMIRRRRAVRLKAKAVTAEIRLSAYVLGSLPFLTTAGLLFIQPDYLAPLFQDPRGHFILALAFGGLLLSALAMHKMMSSVSKA